MPIDPAAEHMSTALKAIYSLNTSPFVRRFASGGVMLTTGESDVFGNFAVGLVGDEWDEATKGLSSVSSLSCLLQPGERTPGFEDQVSGSGFTHAASIPAMAVGLDQLPDVPLCEGYMFERLTRERDAGQWAAVLEKGYPVAKLSAESMSPLHVKVNDEDEAPLQFFQVRTGAETVGISALALLDGLAGVYCVTTLPEHRQRGLGAVLTSWPLKRARDIGYRTGVLQASQAGYAIYQKLGFVETGAVQMYVRATEG